MLNQQLSCFTLVRTNSQLVCKCLKQRRVKKAKTMTSWCSSAFCPTCSSSVCRSGSEQTCPTIETILPGYHFPRSLHRKELPGKRAELMLISCPIFMELFSRYSRHATQRAEADGSRKGTLQVSNFTIFTYATATRKKSLSPPGKVGQSFTSRTFSDKFVQQCVCVERSFARFGFCNTF